MAPPDLPPLAALLRSQMRLLGLSQAAVADHVGVSQQTVSKWMTGETHPRVKLFPALADVLGVEVTDLSAALVAGPEPEPLDPETEVRVAALDRRIRDLSPAQLDQLEAYLRGLRDGAASGWTDPRRG